MKVTRAVNVEARIVSRVCVECRNDVLTSTPPHEHNHVDGSKTKDCRPEEARAASSEIGKSGLFHEGLKFFSRAFRIVVQRKRIGNCSGFLAPRRFR